MKFTTSLENLSSFLDDHPKNSRSMTSCARGTGLMRSPSARAPCAGLRPRKTHGGFLKWRYPYSSSICRWDFPYTACILGYSHLWNPPHVLLSSQHGDFRTSWSFSQQKRELFWRTAECDVSNKSDLANEWYSPTYRIRERNSNCRDGSKDQYP